MARGLHGTTTRHACSSAEQQLLLEQIRLNNVLGIVQQVLPQEMLALLHYASGLWQRCAKQTKVYEQWADKMNIRFH